MKRVICLFLGAMLFSAMAFSYDHSLSFKIRVAPESGQITVVFKSGLAYRVRQNPESVRPQRGHRAGHIIEFGFIMASREFRQLCELLLFTTDYSFRYITFKIVSETLSGYSRIRLAQGDLLQESGLAEHFNTVYVQSLASREAIDIVDRSQVLENSRLLIRHEDLAQGESIVMVNPQFIFLLISMRQQISGSLVNEPIERPIQYAMLTMFLFQEGSGLPDILQAFTLSEGSARDSWLLTPTGNTEIAAHQVQLQTASYNQVVFNQFFPFQLTQQHIPVGPFFFPAAGGIVQAPPVQDVRQNLDARRGGAYILAVLALIFAVLAGGYFAGF
ncbi:MAG: hypothetical protein ACR2PT_05700 [Endozoicomonas sp.]